MIVSILASWTIQVRILTAGLLTVCFSLYEFAAAQEPVKSQIRLTDVTAHSGIDFIHSDGGTGKRYIVESVVGGLATLDFDGDGYVDIFFVNGNHLDVSGSEPALRNALYRNNGDFTFTDVTDKAGLGRPGYGMGAVSADYDEDGDPDLYVSNFGKNIFYRNNGDGTFDDTTLAVHLVLPDKVGAGCAFFDIENDGDLDLFVGSYVQFSLDKHLNRFVGKHRFHPGPSDYSPSPDALFRNEGDGTFTNISEPSGILAHTSYSMGVVAFDVDEDADFDLMVCNDQRENTLWINDGQGNFVDQALVAGVAFDRLGKANGNMGVELGDINGDGLIDIFTTTYQDEMPVLYLNLGGGLFMDQTNVMHIENRLQPHVTWGCGLVDFDNDGDLDIYVACGHFMDNIQYIDDRTTVKVRDFVLENRGGEFVDVTAAVGSGLDIVESSRGAAFEDFDNDGDIDVAILNYNARPSILRNDTAAPPGTLLRVVGTRSNRSALGAKTKVSDKVRIQLRQVVAGRGYQSQYGAQQHIALSGDSQDVVEIAWPSGLQESFDLEKSSHRQIVIEGTGRPLVDSAP